MKNHFSNIKLLGVNTFIIITLILATSCSVNDPFNGIIPNAASKFCDKDFESFDLVELKNEFRGELFTLNDLRNDNMLNATQDVINHYSSFGVNQDFIDALIGQVSPILQSDTETVTQALVSNGIISNELEGVLNSDRSDYTAIVQRDFPTLNESLSFWTSKYNAVMGMTSICEYEKEQYGQMNFAFQGLLEYTYTVFDGSEGATIRSCNLWQAIGCFFSAPTNPSGQSFSVVDDIILSIALGAGIGGSLAGPGGAVGGAIVGGVIGLAVSVGTIYLAFQNQINECCDAIGVDFECNNVENVHPTVLGCNDFGLRAFGSGDDIIEWRWENINTTPAVAITTTPYLRVSVPDLVNSSTIKVTTICADGLPLTPFPESINLNAYQDQEPPNNSWAIEPPSVATVGDKFDIACNLGGGAPFQVTWSASFGGGVTQNPLHTYAAEVNFWNPGTVTIFVSTTNTCTGVTHTLTKSVTVVD